MQTADELANNLSKLGKLSIITKPHGAVVEIQLIELVDPSPISPLKDKDFLKEVNSYPFAKVALDGKTPFTITGLWPGSRYEIVISKSGYHKFSETFTAIVGELKLEHIFEPLPITDFFDIPTEPQEWTCDSCQLKFTYSRRQIIGKFYCRECARAIKETTSSEKQLEELIRSFEVCPWGFHDSIEYFTCDSCQLKFTWEVIKNRQLPPYLRYKISRRQIIRGKFYCRKCAEPIKDAIHHRGSSQIQRIAESLKMDVENCNVAGTCEIFKAHHDTFKDDPQRLKTDFLIRTTCGDAKLEKYKLKKGEVSTGMNIDNKWNEILSNNKKKLEKARGDVQ